MRNLVVLVVAVIFLITACASDTIGGTVRCPEGWTGDVAKCPREGGGGSPVSSPSGPSGVSPLLIGVGIIIFVYMAVLVAAKIGFLK